jgi:Flp pilus assembly protein TadG
MSPALNSIPKTWRRTRHFALRLVNDRGGVAAIEFAMIVPIMLVLFFGTVEFSSAVAVDRKVSLTARALSDLTSQSNSVADTDLANFFAATCGIMYPYAGSPCTSSNNPTKAVISELYVDPSTLQARVQWSRSYQGGVARAVDSIVTTVPPALLVGGTWLIFSEVSFRYTPAVGYVMAKAGINLSDVAYTRPRVNNCVYYSSVAPPVVPACAPVP